MSQSFALGPVVPKENNANHWINLYLVVTQLVSLIPIHWIVIYPPGGVLNKFLDRETLPRGPTLYPFICYFSRKRYLFRIPSIDKERTLHPF